jgi:hypothetical protein
MAKKSPKIEQPAHSPERSLAPEDFDVFYKQLAALRFPMDVAEVLEWRYVINHAVDDFVEPPLTPDYRQFRESLEAAVDSFSIDNKHHRERLVKILVMLREIHYAHSVRGRDAAAALRNNQSNNRRARTQSVYFGSFFLVAGIFSVILWLGGSEAQWFIKLLTGLCAYLTWDYFHSLPTLDREMSRLTQQLNEVLRKQIRSIDWKALIHKLSLLLGYKQISGVEVFQIDGDFAHNPQHTRH